MSENIKNTATLFLSIGILFFAAGLLFVLVVVRAKDAGFSTQAIGLLQSSYQIGWLIAAVLIPSLIHRVGHIRVFAAMAAMGSVIILLQILHIQELAWILERLVMGICIAGILVVSESWLNEMSDNSDRGRNLAIYTMVSWGAPVAGIWILRFGEPSSNEFFVIASVLISLAAIPLLLSATPSPKLIKTVRFSLKKLYRISPLGTTGTLLSGMCHGAFFAMVPLYGSEIGLDLGQISTLTALALFSGIVLQWPIALASDRNDRRYVLITTAGLAAVPALYFAFSGTTSIIQQYVAVSMMGAFTLSLYSQCIAHANDHLEPNQVVPAAGLLVLIYGTGYALLPIIVGQLIAILPKYFFVVNALLTAALSFYTGYRTIRRAPVEDQGELIHVSTASPYSTVVRAAEEWADEAESP
jgi:MFS family permease